MKAFKKQTNDSPLLKIRKRLGLTQQQMAEQLSLSRSMVMMAELGKRSLPTHVLVKIAELEIRLAAEPETGAPCLLRDEEPIAAEKFIFHHEILFTRAEYAADKARRNTGKLKKLEEQFKKTSEWLQVIEKYLRVNNEDETVKGWWLKQQQAAKKVLDKCSPAIQAWLKHKINMHDMEAALYQKLKDELKQDQPGYFIEPPGKA